MASKLVSLQASLLAGFLIRMFLLPSAAITTKALDAPCCQVYLPLVQKGWVMLWSDEFNGTGGVDTGNWMYATGTGYSGGPYNWGTGEVEVMTSSTDNVFQSGGFLHIRALHDSTKPPDEGWTSGRIETVRADFQPPAEGIMAVEARIRLPDIAGAAAQGYWPA